MKFTINSDDFELIRDEYLVQIYWQIPIYIQTIDTKIDIFDAICLHNWIRNNNPDFEDLYDNPLYSAIALKILRYLCSVEFNISAGVRLEHMRRLIQDFSVEKTVPVYYNLNTNQLPFRDILIN